MNLYKYIQIISIILGLIGTYFLAYGLKIKRGISEDLEKEIGLNKRDNIIAPADVKQRKGSFRIGLFFITLSALLQVIILLGCSNEINDRGIKVSETFYMKNELMCTIKKSSVKEDIGKNISFIGLMDNNITVLFEDGFKSPMKKVFENERTVTFQLVADATGSVDSFVIDKKTGKFSRGSVGSFAGLCYASASIGICK